MCAPLHASAGGLHGDDLDAHFRLYLFGVGLAVGFRGAVDLDALDVPNGGERLGVRARHAAGTDHGDNGGVLTGHVACADAGVSADAHVLEVTVVDDGEGLAVLDAHQQDQAAEEAGPHAVLLLRASAAVLLLVDDVRLHADGEVAGGRAAFHRAPLVHLRGVGRGDADVDARAAYGLGARELLVRLSERAYRLLHRQDGRDVVVIQDEGHGAPPSAWSVFQWQPCTARSAKALCRQVRSGAVRCGSIEERGQHCCPLFASATWPLLRLLAYPGWVSTSWPPPVGTRCRRSCAAPS